MIVLDASAAADLLLGTDRAAGVARVLTGTDAAHAPDLLDVEVLSVLRRWVGRGWLPVEAGDRAVDDLGDLAVVRHPHAALRRRVWALRDRCAPYDACYVALAQALGGRLLTTDDRLGRAVTDLVDVVTPA